MDEASERLDAPAGLKAAKAGRLDISLCQAGPVCHHQAHPPAGLFQFPR